MGVRFTDYSTNVLVTILMFVMVIFMPLVDHLISRHHRVRLDDSLSYNPEADKFLRIRKIVLIFIFILYLLAVGYVTFFSRSAAKDYLIHISLYNDLTNAIRIDYGFLGFIKVLLTEGPSAALNSVHIENFDDISQVYLNVVMFVPMGYLLPYVFDWFRRGSIRLKTTITCFFLSLAIENIQLISKLGFYDTDDLISNTLGGFIGSCLYIAFAYVLVHPDFRSEIRNKLKWRKKAHNKALYPFLNKSHIQRFTISGNDKEAIRDFYEDKLGLFLKSYVEFDKEAYFLFEYRKMQIEIHANPSFKNLPPQNIVIAFNNIHYFKKRLEDKGLTTSDYRNDPYTNLRCFDFSAPDQVTITIIEE